MDGLAMTDVCAMISGWPLRARGTCSLSNHDLSMSLYIVTTHASEIGGSRYQHSMHFGAGGFRQLHYCSRCWIELY